MPENLHCRGTECSLECIVLIGYILRCRKSRKSKEKSKGFRTHALAGRLS